MDGDEMPVDEMPGDALVGVEMSELKTLQLRRGVKGGEREEHPDSLVPQGRQKSKTGE